MALFKISKGASGGLSNQALGDGYCWFTYDDGKFYIDYKDPTDNVVKRKALNANNADHDHLGNLINSSYAANLTFDNSTYVLTLLAKSGATLATVNLIDYELTGALNGNTYTYTLTPFQNGTALTSAATSATIPSMSAATGSTAGAAGLVPAPQVGAQDKFLRGDGTWVDLFSEYDAMVFKGIVIQDSDLPTSGYSAGWTYRAAADGMYKGDYCEIGDLIIAVHDYNSSTASNADWAKIEHNIDGALFMGHAGSVLSDGTKLLNVTDKGVVTSSSSTVGSSTKPVFLSAGTLTETTHSLNATVNSGTANQVAYYSDANTIASYPTTKGGNAKLWYLNAGVPTDSDATVGTSEKPVYLSSGTITVGNPVWTLKGGSGIPSGTDLNTITTVGNYWNTTTPSRTILNNPYSEEASSSMQAYQLKVETSFGSSEDYLRQQLMIYNSGVKAERHSNNGGSSWSSWRVNVFKNSNASTKEGDSNKPIYIAKNGQATAIDYAINTTVNAGTANRITYYDEENAISATGHYASSTKIAINSTSAPSENFYINGTSRFAIGNNDQASDKRFIIGSSGKRYLSFGGAGIQAYASDDSTGLLYLQYNGGNIQIGQSKNVTSNITAFGDIIPGIDATGNGESAQGFNLGDENTEWRNLFLRSGAINYRMRTDTSAAASLLSIKDTSKNTIAILGFHNTGNGGNGAMYLIPYYAGLGDDSASGGKHGLYIGTTTLKWENKYILRYSETATDGQVIISDGTTGDVKTSGYTIGASIGAGTANRIAYYSEDHKIDAGSIVTNGSYLGSVSYLSINNAHQTGYRLFVNGSQKITSGSLQVYPTGGSYNDGIRIHARSSDNTWAALMLCGSDNTGDTGTSANSWFIGNNNGSLYITKNGSTSSATGYLAATTETVNDTNYGYWAFYHRVGINGKNTDYNLYVNGTSLFTNAVRIQYQGKPANLYLYDNSNDTSTHSIIRLGAATNENGAYIFLNGPSRTNDGGANTLSIRNNVGNLRLNNFTIIEVNNNWLTPSRLQLGRADTTAATSDRAIIGVTDGNLHIDSYDAKEIYLQYYASNKYVRSGHIRPLTTNAYSLGDSSLRWSKLYVGTADSYGAANQPIYWNAGVPAAIDWRVGNSDTGEHNANNIAYNFCGYYTSNGPATTIGASTTDGAIYAQAYNSTWVGQIAQDYRDGGLFVRGKNNGTWQAWKQIPMTTTASVGSTTQPVYINAGTITECTAYTGLLTALSWTAGTTAGPTLSITVGGTTKTAVIPSAAAGASGVVTTGAQQFDGNKTFKGHIYPQANATYDIGSTSLRWRTGYLSTSLLIGGTSYTAGNSAATGSLFAAGYIEMSGSTPFIDFHAGNNTGDYPARIISDTAGRITITGNVTPANLTYNSRSLAVRFQCSGNQYTNGTVESNNSFIVNRAAKDGGFSALTNGQQVARIYCATVGTASNGTTQGAQGVTWLMLGNNIARAAATATTGANNSKGSIRLYNEQTGYSDISGSYVSLGGTARNAVAMGYVNATQVWGAVWNDYAEFRETKENVEPGRCIKEIGDDTLQITTKRLERGCEIVSDTYGFAIGETNKSKTPIASSGRVLAYPYESREEFASHIGWPVCSGPNGTVSIMTEEEEEKYPSRIIGTISAVPDYEEWGTGNVKVNGRVWIRIR